MPARLMIFSPKAIQSAMALNNDDLVFEYTKFIV